MISIQEAIKIIKENLPERKIEERAITESLGSYLAQDIMAPESLPRFNNSAMDGYAVALDFETPAKLPLTLPVIGESQAGIPYTDELQSGEAIQISTGAYVPEGTTLIVPVEETNNGDSEVKIRNLGDQYAHIRFAGEEVAIGDTIARKYDHVTPPLLSWLAGFGIITVQIFRTPRVAILTTGEELTEIDAILKPGQIRNTNQVYLEALFELLRIKPVYTNRIPDSLTMTREILTEASEMADILILSGGVSVGPHDHVKDAAESLGYNRQFWKVAQKPGKPLYFASRKENLLFGLPGNPVSTLISTLVYIYPVLNYLQGNPLRELYCIESHLNKEYKRKKTNRAQYLLVKVMGKSKEGFIVEPAGHQHSHMMSGVTAGDGFLVVPQHTKEMSPEMKQIVYLFPWSDFITACENEGSLQWDA